MPRSTTRRPMPPQPSRAGNRVAATVLLMIGVALWLIAGPDMHWARWLVVLAAVGVSLFPPVNRFIARSLDRIRHPSPREAEWAGLLIGVAATCYLVATALVQGRELFPRTEDDCSYVLAAQMLARGRLWMPAHPLADFFDSFYILVKPVYSSIYFPGAALAFAPMAWFGWPSWIIPVVLSGVSVGLLYRIVTELVNGVAGALAAVWLVALRWFRMLSVVAMSHVPMLLLALLMLWAWLRWRRERRWGWAVALGGFSGWAAITRPADAVCFAIPIGVAVAGAMMKQRAKKWLVTAALVVAGATPFLALQIIFDLGVTGSPLHTPYSYYLEHDQPGAQFGIRRFDPSWRPQSPLPEKQAFYEFWCKPYLLHHHPDNFLGPWLRGQQVMDAKLPPYLLMLVDSTLPSRLLLVLVPVGLLGLVTSGRRVLAAALPVFVAVYLFNPFFLEHYAVIVAPAMALLALMGISAAADAMPRWSRHIASTLTVVTFAVALTSFWELYQFMPARSHPPGDDLAPSLLLSTVNSLLPTQVDQPAVVLFRQRPDRIYFFVEPVYNFDVAWPDDAPIIRAHDLGSRDGEIIEYYAARPPNRTFYVFDMSTLEPTRLGTAVELRDKLRGGMSVDAIVHPQK